MRSRLFCASPATLRRAVYTEQFWHGLPGRSSRASGMLPGGLSLDWLSLSVQVPNICADPLAPVGTCPQEMGRAAFNNVLFSHEEWIHR